MDKVGIIGVGYEGFRPSITDLSTRELMFEASYKAYDDAGVDPRKDVGSFISCDEDLWDGWSITDEMVPDQMGGAQRSVCTVPADGITGLGHAVMQIRSGLADVVAVEAHSKVADVVDKEQVEMMGIEPTYLRPVGVSPSVLAGMEMDLFLRRTGFSRRDCTEVVVNTKKKALKNERASYGARLSDKEVEESDPVSLPLRDLDVSRFAEASVNIVVASERWIKKNRADAVYIDGISWTSYNPWYEEGEVSAPYMSRAFREACKQAGLPVSLEGFDILELDDTYSYKLLQHLVAISGSVRAAKAALRDKDRVNPSGGSLGVGHLIEATGLHKVLEATLQLRGKAGGVQLRGVKRCLASSWRGHPTSSGAVVILSR